jgi:hypothetical protein
MRNSPLLTRRTDWITSPFGLPQFMAPPAGAAVFLGHQWNMIPTNTVYEHQVPGYEPTMTFPG